MLVDSEEPPPSETSSGDGFAKKKSTGNASDATRRRQQKVAISIRGQPVVLQEDWNHGIGGGLWSTGLALAKYLDTSHAQEQLEQRKIRTVLELGSGNGFLAVCLAMASPFLEEIVVTDTQGHLPLIQATIDANASLFAGKSSTGSSKKIKVTVQEYLWGTGPLKCSSDDGSKGSTTTAFDLIIGSDLAYRDELHDPLIQAILDCSGNNSSTVTLLGVTMNDTKPIFFSKLAERGLLYERLADHCLDPSFRGNNFGIFVIQKRR